jgi:hypothetical protein
MRARLASPRLPFSRSGKGWRTNALHIVAAFRCKTCLKPVEAKLAIYGEQRVKIAAANSHILQQFLDIFAVYSAATYALRNW